MSRIGKKPIVIPADVTVAVTDGSMMVKGPRGALSRRLHPNVSVAVMSGALRVSVAHPEDQKDRALWGLTRALAANMVAGVTEGFTKKLEFNGVGYRASVSGKTITLELGFSHPVVFPLPDGVAAAIEKNVIALAGIDNELLGETAARLRRLRPVEPYKGKGIKYQNEIVRRKAGKAAKAGAAAK